MPRVSVEFVGGPLCGNTDALQAARAELPERIGLYRTTGQRTIKNRHRYDFHPLLPAARRPPCDRHKPPRPGCPGYAPAKPP